MLTKYQEHLYKLYKEIDAICEKFDIEYCAAGGTMIGTIRHRGFIPWDDDMDIYMTLKNWRKFMEVCQQDGVLPEGRVLACQEFDRTYHNPIARYTDITMTTIHRNQVLHDDEAGFVIDVFALDPLPDDKESAEQYNRDVLLFSDLINGSIVYSYRFRANKYRYFWYRGLMHLLGREKVLQKVEDKLTKYDEDTCKFYAMRWGGVPLVFPKDMIGDCHVRYPYEDSYTRCPNKSFDYLVYHYGDEWMYVPPEAEQESHEAVAVFSTEVAYPNLREEIFTFADKKKTRRKFRTRQNIAILHENSWNDLKDKNLELKKTATELQLSRNYSEQSEEIEQLAAENKYSELSMIFGDFVAVQNDRKTIGRFDAIGAYRYYAPILIDIKQKYFELVLRTLFHTGRIAVAKRFIDVYELNKGEKTPYMKELDADIMKFREAVSHFSLNEFSQAVPLIDELHAKYPDSMGIILLQISRCVRIDGIDKTRDRVRELAEHGLELFPKNKDFIKCILDTRFADEKDDILIKYAYLYRRLLNGFFRLDIHDVVAENLDFYFDYCDEHLFDVLEESPLAEFSDEDELDESDALDEDEEDADDEEQFMEDTVNLKKEKEEKIRYKSISLINKIIGIIPDNAKVYEKKLQILKKFADRETDPFEKALAQHRLIKYIRGVTRKYNSKFEDGQYPEIQTLVQTWFRTCYREITGSSYVTKMTEIFYQKREFEERKALLEQLLADMENMNKDSSEYLYSLELACRIYNKLGMSRESVRCMLECLEKSDIPYLNRRLRKKLKKEVVSIYKKLYSSYNKYFIHRGAETKGLTKEEAFFKELKNKQRLIRFYKAQIDSVYPGVLKMLEYLCKLRLIDEDASKLIVKKYKLTPKTRFTLRTATAICMNFENMNFAFFDEDSIEEIDEAMIDRATEQI